MSTATVNKDVPKSAAEQTPEYTTIRKDIAYGYATATIKDGEVKAIGKKEAVILDVDEANKLSEAGHFEGNVITTVVNLPQNWAAVRAMESKVYTDDKGEVRDTTEVLNELVTLFRPGMTVKATNRRNQRLLETDKDGNFTFTDADLVDGVYDLTNEITSPSKRIVRTEEQKTWDNLANLPSTVREQVWRAYLTATGKDFYLPAE